LKKLQPISELRTLFQVKLL